MQRFIKQTSSSSGRLIRICGDDKMVNITDVKQILQFAIDAEIKVFLDGGWGVMGAEKDQKNDGRNRKDAGRCHDRLLF